MHRDTAQALETSNKQNSLLLKEVHHRVRNNLQLLVSILNMQERQSVSQEAKAALNSFRQRVMGLSAVYERIYQASDLSEHLSADLVEDVIASFLRFENLSSRQFKVSVDDTTLSQDKAIHLAMFIAEALAYLSQTRDALDFQLELATDPAGTCHLTLENHARQIEDIGNGLSEKLLHAFAVQLGGEIVFAADASGVQITLSFDPQD